MKFIRSVRIECALAAALLLCLPGCGALTAPLAPVPAPLPAATPWDLQALREAPPFEWIDQGDVVHALRYEALPYADIPTTQVFAYYASPATLAPSGANTAGPFPGIVLVHGGGGTAFPQWARLWAERGYAAIAMDLGGKGPDGTRLPKGGPDQGNAEKFEQIGGPVSEQWSYHAVANVVLAHSLLRSLPEVDADRTAVTGISWGGYLTNIVAGVDDRFAAAVPVYGCGHLQAGSAWTAQFAAMTPEHRAQWQEWWDPASYMASVSMPIFFVNGTNDFAYWLEAYAMTYEQVRAHRNYRITVNMPHSHEDGWAPQEIGQFIDEHLIGGTPLPKLADPRVIGDTAQATIASATPLVAGELHYTTDSTPSPDRTWQSVAAEIRADTLHAPAPPPEARIWFFTVSDARQAVVSSALVFP